MVQVNLLDALLLIILLIFSCKGLFRGLVQEVAGLLGVIAGILFARAFSSSLADFLVQYEISTGVAPYLAAGLLFFAAILSVGLIARLLKKILDAAFATGIDRLLGFFAGAVKGFVCAGIIAYVAVKFFSSADVVMHSQITPYLMKIIKLIIGNIDFSIPDFS